MNNLLKQFGAGGPGYLWLLLPVKPPGGCFLPSLSCSDKRARQIHVMCGKWGIVCDKRFVERCQPEEGCVNKRVAGRGGLFGDACNKGT